MSWSNNSGVCVAPWWREVTTRDGCGVGLIAVCRGSLVRSYERGERASGDACRGYTGVMPTVSSNERQQMAGRIAVPIWCRIGVTVACVCQLHRFRFATRFFGTRGSITMH